MSNSLSGILSLKNFQTIQIILNYENNFLFLPWNEDWDVVEVWTSADVDEIGENDGKRSFGWCLVTLLGFSVPPLM